MKWILILFLFISSFSWGQTVFTSSYTEQWPNIFKSQIENVERSISVDESEIIIMTDTQQGRDVETLLVQSMTEKDERVEFKCISKNGSQFVTVIIPLKERIEIMDIYRPSKATGEEIQLRFHLN